MAEESYYELLQVQPTADLEIIQVAYRRLMLRYHPDRNRSPDAEEMAIRLNLALEILTDPGKRETYDRELAASARRTTGGTRQGGSRLSSPPPPDLHHPDLHSNLQDQRNNTQWSSQKERCLQS